MSTATDDRRIHLRDYWRVAWQGKWMVLTVAFVVTTLVAVATFLQTPIYRAATAIEIQPKAKSINPSADFSQLGVSSWSWAAEERYLNTQMKIIRSRNISEKAAAAHRLHPFRLLAREVAQLVEEPISQLRRAFDELVGHDDFQHGVGRRAGEGIAAERGAVLSESDRVGDGVCDQDGGDREPSTEPLAEGDRRRAATVLVLIARARVPQRPTPVWISSEDEQRTRGRRRCFAQAGEVAGRSARSRRLRPEPARRRTPRMSLVDRCAPPRRGRRRE